MDFYSTVTIRPGDAIKAEWLPERSANLAGAPNLKLSPKFEIVIGDANLYIQTKDRAVALALANEILRALDATESVDPADDTCDCGHARRVHDSDWGVEITTEAATGADPTSCDIEGCDCEAFEPAAVNDSAAGVVVDGSEGSRS